MLQLLLSTASPSPSPAVTVPDEALVTPGVFGFLITFGVAVLAIVLFYDMVRRMRRVRYREEIREALAAEVAERNAAESDSTER